MMNTDMENVYSKPSAARVIGSCVLVILFILISPLYTLYTSRQPLLTSISYFAPKESKMSAVNIGDLVSTDMHMYG